MTRSTEVEVKVGVFVVIGVALTMFTIIMLGGGKSIFTRGLTYRARFHQVEGLMEGAIVKVSGMKAGQVDRIVFLDGPGVVEVFFSVSPRFASAIRQDTTVGIQTQGMLGDKIVTINPGSAASPMIGEGSEIRAETPKDFKDYLTDADEVFGRLKSSLTHIESILGSFRKENRAENFFRNITGFSGNVSEGTRDLKTSMNHLNSIFTKIDRGEGTLGALVNDPALYDDMRALLGGANRNRVLKYFIRKSVEESRDAAKSSSAIEKK